jgi:hypothetical protein
MLLQAIFALPSMIRYSVSTLFQSVFQGMWLNFVLRVRNSSQMLRHETHACIYRLESKASVAGLASRQKSFAAAVPKQTESKRLAKCNSTVRNKAERENMKAGTCTVCAGFLQAVRF